MALQGIIAGLGFLLSGYSAYKNIQLGKEQASINRRRVGIENQGIELQQRRDQVKARRLRLTSVREGRLKRARAVSNASQSNAQGSTQGGFGSIVSQTNATLQYGFQSNQLGFQANNLFAQAAQLKGQEASLIGSQNTYQSFASAGANIFQNSKQLAKLGKSIFS